METFWIILSLVLAVMLVLTLWCLNVAAMERDAYMKRAAYWWNRWRKASR